MFSFVLFLKRDNSEHVSSWSPGNRMRSLVNPTSGGGGESKTGSCSQTPLASSQLGMSKKGDSGSQSNCTTPKLIWAMSHMPPVSPQCFDAILPIALVTLLTCLPGPPLSESRRAAPHFLCVPLCLAPCLTLGDPSLIVCQMNEHR